MAELGSGPTGIYTVSVMTDTGPLQSWLNSVTSTSANFPGEFGHRYTFVVTTTDNVNNVGQGTAETVVTQVTKYYYIGSSRVAMRQGDAVTYLHTDHLGTVSVATSGNGQFIARTLNLPYGGVRWTDGTMPTDWGYTGQKEPIGTGLVYLHARFYAPATGRFISPDTVVPILSNPQDWNRYSYARNNPLGYTDPSGHDPCAAFAGAVGAGTAAMGAVPAYAACVGVIAFLSWIFVDASAHVIQQVAEDVTVDHKYWNEQLADVNTNPDNAPEPEPERPLTPLPIPFRITPTETPEPERLYAFGGSPQGEKPGPRVRPNTDIPVDNEGMVDAQFPPFPNGASTFSDLNLTPLTGHYYYIPKNSPMPPGIAVFADGSDVMPGSQNAPTHHTIYPTRRMSFEQFRDLFLSLPWVYGGNKKAK